MSINEMTVLIIIAQLLIIAMSFCLGVIWRIFAEKRERRGELTEKITFACPEHKDDEVTYGTTIQRIYRRDMLNTFGSDLSKAEIEAGGIKRPIDWTGLEDLNGNPIRIADIVEYYYDERLGHSKIPMEGYAKVEATVIKGVDGKIYFLSEQEGKDCFASAEAHFNYCRVIGGYSELCRQANLTD